MKYTLYQDLLPSNETQLLRRIFSDLEFLGVIQKYGYYCLFMSSLLAEILKALHFEVELRACVAVIDQGVQKRFLLGAKEYSRDGQLPSHIICIVNRTVLLDFGLGNARRLFAPHFFQGMILPVSQYQATKGQVLCSVKVDQQHEIHYVVDEMPETFDTELEAQAELLQQTLKDYQRYTRNRLRFNLAQVLQNAYGARPSSQAAAADLRSLAGDFYPTWNRSS